MSQNDQLEAGTCSSCRRRVWLAPDGLVADHARIPGHPSEGVCRGSRLPSSPSAAAAPTLEVGE